MVNRQKIITMTKLALYDKHEGAADRDANDYFRHDYIYKKNLGTRVCVAIGGAMILALQWMRIIFLEGVDIFEINVQDHLLESILFILALVAVYSLIGTVQGTREYYLVQKRLNRYQGMLRFLENAEERAVKPEAEEPERLRREPPLTDRSTPRPTDPLANVSSRALTSRPNISTPIARPRPGATPPASVHRPGISASVNAPAKRMVARPTATAPSVQPRTTAPASPARPTSSIPARPTATASNIPARPSAISPSSPARTSATPPVSPVRPATPPPPVQSATQTPPPSSNPYRRPGANNLPQVRLNAPSVRPPQK